MVKTWDVAIAFIAALVSTAAPVPAAETAPAERASADRSPAAVVLPDVVDPARSPNDAFAEALRARGIAVRVLEFGEGRFADHAAAVVGAVEELRRDSAVDSTRVAIVALGRSGWIAALADSASPHVASVVRIGAPEVPPFAHARFVLAREMTAAKVPADAVRSFGALYPRLVEYVVRRSDARLIRAAIDSTLATKDGKRAYRQRWLRDWISWARDRRLAPADSLPLPPWALDFAFDPAPLTCASATPTFSIFGELDTFVHVSESANRLRDALDFCSGTTGEVWIVPGADHEGRAVAAEGSGVPSASAPRAPAPFADGLFDRVADWIARHSASAR